MSIGKDKTHVFYEASTPNEKSTIFIKSGVITHTVFCSQSLRE